MPFNGIGGFTLVAGNPVVTGTTISSTVQNNTMTDFANGFANCVTRDGQSPALANIPMGGFKITGLAAGTTNGDAVRWEQAVLAASLANTSTGATSGSTLVGNKYEATGSAALNLHSYIEDDGAYNVMGFIDEADKAAIRAGTSTVDVSAEIEDALAVAYDESPKGLRFAAGQYSVIAGATLTVAGNRTNHGFRISGVGQYGSRIVKASGANAPLTITTTTPTTDPVEIGLSISDLGFVGASKGSHGLNLIGIANFELERLAIRGFDYGLKLDSTLIGLVRSCYISDNNIGVRTRQNGSNANCNAIEFQTCAIKYNSTWGADIGEANGISFTGWSDIERNGTTATLTTGGIIIRSTLGDDSGIGIMSLDKVWLESNYGRTIDVESSTDLFLTVRQANILSPEGGYAMRVQGGRSISFENSVAAGNTATLDITCEKFSMYNARADVVTDNSTYGIYDNSGTSAADYVSGRTGSHTASLTGCTTVPTGSVTWTKQGKSVTLNVPVITGTSNTTSATLTGMPATLYPLTARQTFAAVVDNGTEKFAPITIGTSGVITLNNAFSGTFTNSGTKGTSSGWTITYEI